MAPRVLAALSIATSVATAVALSPSLGSLPVIHSEYGICKCHNFRYAYMHDAATCGEGNEFQPTEENAAQLYRSDSEEQKRNICSFHYMLDVDVCINLKTGVESGTWCYTDPRCLHLNGGKHVPGRLSWKMCQDGGRHPDPLLRSFSPEQLEDIAKDKDEWLDGLVRAAYVGARGDRGVVVNATDFQQIPGEVLQRRDELGPDSNPVWFDTNPEGKPPLIVVRWGTAWKVAENPDKDPMHPGTWSKLTCLVGC